MSSSRIWKRVTIVGCGLIGSSFALALKQHDLCERVAGWDASTRSLDEAVRLGVIDEIDHAFAQHESSASDLIYLSMPVGAIIAFLRENREFVAEEAVITDCGSTKVNVCRAAEEHLSSKHRFVGGHPIAGSHLTGPMNARADLFTGAPYIIVANETDEAAQSVRRTLETFGARVRTMSAEDHDRVMAYLSHLPQLLSSLLYATVKENIDEAEMRDLAGTGYRDMTRLSASSWEMWRDIFATNSELITEALAKLQQKLSLIEDELRRNRSSIHEAQRLSALFGVNKT